MKKIREFFIGLFLNCSLARPASAILGKELWNSLLTNQFAQSNTIGVLDLVTNPHPAVFTCRYTHATAGIGVGTGVQLVDLGANDSAGPPYVTLRTADTDPIFGVVIYDTKKTEWISKNRIQVASTGGVIWMNAHAAIPRGTAVALVLATPGDIITRTTETVLGISLDKATAADELIRVYITANGILDETQLN